MSMRRIFGVLAVLLLGLASAARADVVSYDLAGAPGDQVSSPATFVTPGLTALNLSRGPGLTPNAGSNSINAASWSTDPTDFFLLGFNVAPGFVASINQLAFAGRSSNTGPGFIRVSYSVNGGAETTLTTFALSGTSFNNQLLNFSPIVATGSLQVYFRAANTTSANGGTIGSTGTFRLGNYSPDGGATFLPVGLGGSVTTAAVPEPSQMVLAGIVAVGFVATRLRLRRRRDG